MKRMKRYVTAALIAIVLSLGVGAVIPQAAGVVTAQAATVKINRKKATLIKGKTTTLKITGTKKKVKWASSSKDVATVSSKGKVTAKSKGTAKITATVNKKKYTCTVKVESPSLSDTKVTLVMKNKKTKTLKLNGTSLKVTWKSSNKKVATVSSKGKVTAKKAGKATITATITATSGKKSYKCAVTVVNKAPAEEPDKNVEWEPVTLTEGDNTTLEISGGSAASFTWTSSNEDVAVVSPIGVVQALKAGETTITAKGSGVTYTCKVTVVARGTSGGDPGKDPTDDPTIQPSEGPRMASDISLGEGVSRKLAVQDAREVSGWSSDNASIASVDSSGLVTAVKRGVTTVRVQADGKTLTCRVRVGRLLDIDVPGKTLTLSKAETIKVYANYTGDAGPRIWTPSQDVYVDCEGGEYKYTNDDLAEGYYLCTLTPKTPGTTTLRFWISDENNVKLAEDYLTVTVNMGSFDGFDELANSIEAKGIADSSGNKYISEEGDKVRITHDRAANTFRFVYSYNGSSLTMTMAKGSGSASVVYTFTGNSTYRATATLNAASYTNSTTLPFVVESGSASFDVAAMANTYMQYALSWFDSLLQSQCGMSIQHLGFTSFTPMYQ